MLIIIIKDKTLRIKKNLFENMKDSCANETHISFNNIIIIFF